MEQHAAVLPTLVAAACAALATSRSTAQTLVKDIATGTTIGSSSISSGVAPFGLVTQGNRTFLAAGSRSDGVGLLITDGTPAGTLAVEPNVRVDGHSPSQFVVLANGTVLYRARSEASGAELHASDGTVAGSGLVLDIYPGLASSVPDGPGNGGLFTVLGNQLLFAALDGVHGSELWTSDGTAAGTQLLVDLNPGAGHSSPTAGCRLGNRVVFGAYDPVYGSELRITDGTAVGTTLVVDLNPGPGSTGVGSLTSFGNFAVFLGATPGTGREPWITDGTAAGTRLLADIAPGAADSFPREFTVAGGLCYFTAESPAIGRELYVTDGTAVTLLGDLCPSPFSGPGLLAAVGNEIGFFVDDGVHGSEIWWTDGTVAGTRRVSDLANDPNGGLLGTYAVGNRLAFLVSTVGIGEELWVSDGTTAGTSLVRDIVPGPGSPHISPLGIVNGELWFAADDGVHGRELWSSDLTPAGTRLLLDLQPDEPNTSFPGPLVRCRDRVVFAAFEPSSGYELWVTDGTTVGTTLLADLWPGADSSSPSFLRRFGDRVVFSARTATEGSEPWVTDGTIQGTQLLRDVVPGAWGSYPVNFVEFRGELFFSANDGSGRTLWKTDGTSGGTRPVGPSTMRIGASERAQTIHALDDRLVIIAQGALWSCDGTNPATQLALAAPTAPSDAVTIVHRGQLYFLAKDNQVETLWKTDGTVAGTTLLATTRGPCYSLFPTGEFAARGDLVYLSISDDCGDPWSPSGPTGRELWVTDGTVAGTTQIADFWPGSGSSTPMDLLATPDRVFFHAVDQVHGREMWQTDGTALGTTLVADLYPGVGSSITESRVMQAGIGNRIVWAADDGTHGRELWVSDGTPAGTRRLTDLQPGAGHGIPRGARFDPAFNAPVVLGDRLLFVGDDGTSGAELYSLPLAALGAASFEFFGTGCAGHAGMTPALSADGVPALGDTFGIDLAQANPASPATLLVQFARQDLTLPGGCVVHPALPAIALPVTTSPSGTASVAIPVASTDPALVGLDLVLQWAVLDPSGAYQGALAFSNGVRVRIGAS